jgi:hypothetical protein
MNIADPQWTQSQLDRKAQIEAGQTIVANVSVKSPDKALVDWAKANDRFVYVGDRVRFTELVNKIIQEDKT